MRGPFRLLLLAAAAAIPALAALPVPVNGQAIRGLALDPDGRPLGGATIALHRVDDAGGAFVDAAVTDADGRFTFDVEAGDSAVHFVALRHEDRLYIGPPIRGGAPAASEYVVRAEPSAEAGALASALSGSQPGSQPGAGGAAVGGRQGGEGRSGGAAARGTAAGTGAFWLVSLLALATAAILLTQAPRYRTRRRRDLLVELAAVENRLAEASGADNRATLEARRAALRGRLEPAG